MGEIRGSDTPMVRAKSACEIQITNTSAEIVIPEYIWYDELGFKGLRKGVYAILYPFG
jgi:hypothetical protein